MNEKEKSCGGITFEDVNGSSWVTTGKVVLGISMLLPLNILFTYGIVDTIYGSPAAKEHWKLVGCIAIGSQSLALFVTGLVFMKRPVVAFIVFMVLSGVSFVAAPMVVKYEAPDIADCEHSASVKDKNYYMRTMNAGFVCREYVSHYYGP